MVCLKEMYITARCISTFQNTHNFFSRVFFCIKKIFYKSGWNHQFFHHRSMKYFDVILFKKTHLCMHYIYVYCILRSFVGSFIHCNTTWHSNLNLPFLFNFTLIIFEIKKTRKIIPTNRNLGRSNMFEGKKNLHKKCIQKIIKIQSKMLKSTLWPHICFLFSKNLHTSYKRIRIILYIDLAFHILLLIVLSIPRKM